MNSISELLLTLEIVFAAFAGIWGAAIGYVVLRHIRDDKQKKKKENYIPDL